MSLPTVQHTYEAHVAERHAYNHVPLDRATWSSWRFNKRIVKAVCDPCDDWSQDFKGERNG